MATTVRRHSSVRWDILEIYDFIALDNYKAAEKVVSAIEIGVFEISRTPDVGPPYETAVPHLQSLRMYPVPGFQDYLIFYQHNEVHIEILYVVHGARDLHEIFDEDIRY